MAKHKPGAALVAPGDWRVLELRSGGMSVWQIAATLNVSVDDVTAALREQTARLAALPDQDDLALELTALERLLVATLPLALDPPTTVDQAGEAWPDRDLQLKAVETARKLLADRRDLRGLVGPKVKPSTPNPQLGPVAAYASMTLDDMQALAAAAGYKVVKA